MRESRLPRSTFIVTAQMLVKPPSCPETPIGSTRLRVSRKGTRSGTCETRRHPPLVMCLPTAEMCLPTTVICLPSRIVDAIQARDAPGRACLLAPTSSQPCTYLAGARWIKDSHRARGTPAADCAGPKHVKCSAASALAATACARRGTWKGRARGHLQGLAFVEEAREVHVYAVACKPATHPTSQAFNHPSRGLVHPGDRSEAGPLRLQGVGSIHALVGWLVDETASQRDETCGGEQGGGRGGGPVVGAGGGFCLLWNQRGCSRHAGLQDRSRIRPCSTPRWCECSCFSPPPMTTAPGSGPGTCVEQSAGQHGSAQLPPACACRHVSRASMCHPAPAPATEGVSATPRKPRTRCQPTVSARMPRLRTHPEGITHATLGTDAPRHATIMTHAPRRVGHASGRKTGKRKQTSDGRRGESRR